MAFNKIGHNHNDGIKRAKIQYLIRFDGYHLEMRCMKWCRKNVVHCIDGLKSCQTENMLSCKICIHTQTDKAKRKQQRHEQSTLKRYFHLFTLTFILNILNWIPSCLSSLYFWFIDSYDCSRATFCQNHVWTKSMMAAKQRKHDSLFPDLWRKIRTRSVRNISTF